jgi:hypothetical protein
VDDDNEVEETGGREGRGNRRKKRREVIKMQN